MGSSDAASDAAGADEAADDATVELAAEDAAELAAGCWPPEQAANMLTVSSSATAIEIQRNFFIFFSFYLIYFPNRKAV
ncbi:hypothetical protein FACS1894191_1790 [Clostridia bacterium]|nr:hypothetical protein FACS1894191_1790 [Clostridia bacterium]